MMFEENSELKRAKTFTDAYQTVMNIWLYGGMAENCLNE
jgi:hypothetical protein